MLATLNLHGYKLTCSVSHRIVVHRVGSLYSLAEHRKIANCFSASPFPIMTNSVEV